MELPKNTVSNKISLKEYLTNQITLSFEKKDQSVAISLIDYLHSSGWLIHPVEEIAEELKGEICIGKMNVDENSQIPGSLGIRGIPTLMLYANGEVKTTQVGALSKSDLINLIKSNI